MSVSTYGSFAHSSSLHSSTLPGSGLVLPFPGMNTGPPGGGSRAPVPGGSRTLTPQSSILMPSSDQRVTSTYSNNGSRKAVHFRDSHHAESTTYYSGSSAYGIGGKSTTALEMPQFDPAETGSLGSADTPDSGVGDPDFHVLHREELHQHCKKFTQEIRNLAYLTDDFRSDVIRGTQEPVSLLDEYSFKIKPYLVKLDERLATLEELVRRNLDRCKISEPRVDWLIQYHGVMTSFREMIASLNVQLYERMEAALRLQARGCEGATLSKQEVETGQRTLKKITQELDLIQDVKMKV